jgi:P-type Cu+ transporter
MIRPEVGPSSSSHLGCFQCGLPLRPPRRRSGGGSGGSGASDGAPQFCCYGCALVHQIAGSGPDRREPAWILARLGLSAFLAMNVMALSLVLYAETGSRAPADPLYVGLWGLFRYVLLIFSAPVILLLGWPILESGLKGAAGGRFSVDSLIALGAMGAFGFSVVSTFRQTGNVYYETACMTLVLVTLGRYLEARARTRAAAALQGLLGEEPRTVAVLRDGVLTEIPAADVMTGDTVRITAGEVVPVDGTILDGEGGVDESSLTGETIPVRRAPGDPLMAGTLSVDGAFLLRATATGEERMAARIGRLLDAARASRAPMEQLADRIASAFVPLSVAAALASGIAWGLARDPVTGWLNALAVLLIACPCALGLATPLAVWEGMGASVRRGIVIRGGDALERLASVRSIFFDKTGTLTGPIPTLAECLAAPGESSDRALAAAAGLETVSDHPLARAIRGAAKDRAFPLAEVREFRVHPGVGVEGILHRPGESPRRLAVGGGEMLRRLGAPLPAWAGAAAVARQEKPVSFLLEDGAVKAAFLFEEAIRPEAERVLRELEQEGLQMEILTGDNAAAGAAMGRRLGIRATASLGPAGKLEAISRGETERGPAAMVGEGVNDAPALAGASLSIAVGGAAALAREAADITLLGGSLENIPWLVRLSRRTVRTIRVNLFWAFAYNAILIPLAMAGLLKPVLAALAMIASSLFVVGNSLRLGRFGAVKSGGSHELSPGAPRLAEARP